MNNTASVSMGGGFLRCVSQGTCAKFGMFALSTCEIPPWVPGKDGGGIEEDPERPTGYATIHIRAVRMSVVSKKSATSDI